MALNETQTAFVTRFLGVKTSTAPTAARISAALISHVRDGQGRVDKAVSGLRDTLKTHGHADLARIAEAPLTVPDATHRTALEQALSAYGSAKDADVARAQSAVLTSVAAFRSNLAEDKLIALCEANPFGATVDIKAPLEAVLTRIEKVFAQIAQRSG